MPENVQKPKVLLGIPTMSSVHSLLLLCVSTWIAEAAESGLYNLSIYPTVSVQPVDNARNEIVKVFLESDCTHLFFIDSDTIPPLNALRLMLAYDKDIITALTPIIKYDENRKNDSGGFYPQWNVVTLNDEVIKEDIGLQEVKTAGSSCIMIKREVFEKIPKPWYRFLYEDDNGKETQISEDVLFCIKAANAGFKVWCDTTMKCGHAKQTIWR